VIPTNEELIIARDRRWMSGSRSSNRTRHKIKQNTTKKAKIVGWSVRLTPRFSTFVKEERQ
jgi:hypothetical protein